MAIESKASVAVSSITEVDASDILRLFGLEPEAVEPLYGGYSSSNFKVVAKRPDGAASTTLVLKICYEGMKEEDAEHQVFVLQQLRKSGFRTNYLHPTADGGFLVHSHGRYALLLDFIVGRPGDTVLAEDETKTTRLLTEMGAALVELHEVPWPADRPMRDIRCGFPVCNMGDLLAGKDLRLLQADPRFAAHPLVAFLAENEAWLRELFTREVPWGLIHGDAFLDNTLFEDGPRGSGECRLLALVDWEDSCVAPYVLDLAVCAGACCFTATNELLGPRMDALLGGYHSRRPLSAAELESLADFMCAGAAACAFYRFLQFVVKQASDDAQAKDSYKIMLDRAQQLRSGVTREGVVAAVHRLSASA